MTHLSFFFLKDTPPPEIYTLPLHDALPISRRITHVCTVPPMAAALFRQPIPEDTALRWMNIGGDRLARGLDQLVPFERSEEHTSELQSQSNLVCRLLLEKKNNKAPAAFPLH